MKNKIKPKKLTNLIAELEQKNITVFTGKTFRKAMPSVDNILNKSMFMKKVPPAIKEVTKNIIVGSMVKMVGDILEKQLRKKMRR